MAASMQEDESSFTGPKFVPPVYSQRYGVALDMAAKIQAKKVKNGFAHKRRNFTNYCEIIVYLC